MKQRDKRTEPVGGLPGAPVRRPAGRLTLRSALLVGALWVGALWVGASLSVASQAGAPELSSGLPPSVMVAQAASPPPTTGPMDSEAAEDVAAAQVPVRSDSSLPTLIIETRESRPGELTREAERLRAYDREGLNEAMDVAGVRGAGPPIYVILAAEGTALARQTPPWVSGYARGSRSVTVLFPGRVPKYPDGNLEAVLQHEVAHILVHRGAGGRPVPRWFNEGVAMAAARPWTLEDRGRLTWGVLTGGPGTLGEVERAFRMDETSVATAYAVSSSAVRQLRADHGPEVTGAILGRVAAGESFDDAFARVVGETLAEFERAFFRRQTFLNRWLPFLTSSAVLWIAITLLFLFAYRRRRERDAEIALAWEAEEQARAEAQVEIQRRARQRAEMRVIQGGGAEEHPDRTNGKDRDPGRWFH